MSRKFRRIVRGVGNGDPIYYVDATNGNDNYSGLTQALAWKTITKVNAATLIHGSTVLFKRGETFAGTMTPTISGVSGKPITYSDYGSGAAPIILGGAAAYTVNIPQAANSAEYLVFRNLHFSGSTGAVCRMYSRYILMEDCIVEGCTAGYGIASSATQADMVHDNIFRRLSIYDNAKSGIQIGVTDPGYPYNMIVEDCDIHDNGTSTSADHGIYVDAGVIVRRNGVYNNAAGGIKCNSEFGIDMRYLPQIYDNTIYGNYMGIVMAHHYMNVWNNLIYANTNYNIYWEVYVSNCTVVFNTLVNVTSASSARGVSWNVYPNEDNIFKNNIVIQDSAVVARECMSVNSTGRLTDVTTNNTFDYNVYYFSASATAHLFIDGSGGTNLDFTEWKALAASPDPHGTQLLNTPDFVTRYTDLHPADGGDLKGKGVAIAGYELDKDGNTRANPPTPGCYELAAA